MANRNELVDTKGAQPLTGLSYQTLCNMRVSGEGPPFVKIGACVRYRVGDLEDWIAARVVHSTSEKVAA